MKNAAGIPGFWLQVLKNHKRGADIITEKDEAVLLQLIDVRSRKHHEGYGFTILFYFNENEYFENSVLEKHYYLDQPSVLKKTEGSQIQW